MTIVLDTDILSMFAKVEAVSMLKDLFGEGNLAITPGIEEEISIPLDYGYDFPSKALSKVETIPLTDEALSKHRQLLVVSFQGILRALWESGLKTKKEVKSILEEIEKADNLAVSRAVEQEIFED